MHADVGHADPARAAAIGARLATIHAAIAERMCDLPIYNAKLAVEAVGFRAYRGHALGVLVTPWFMNIVLAELDAARPLPEAGPGDIRRHVFPAGAVDLVVGEVPGFGRTDSASLFSPMFAFDDPAVARETAGAALVALLDPELAERTLSEAAPAPPPDRRAMLFGRGAA